MSETTEVSSRGRGRLYAYAPFLIWAAVVLVLGSGPGSSAQTSRFIRPIIEFFFPAAPPDTFLLIHSIIRKTAHFVEYAILAALAVRAFSTSPNDLLRRNCVVVSIAAAAAIACIDEFNQSFQNSRTASPWDVLLDICGAFAGVLLVLAFGQIRERRRTKRTANRK